MPRLLKQEYREFALRVLNLVAAACGAGALACLVTIVGFELSPSAHVNLEATARALLVIFVGHEAMRVALQERPLVFLRTRWVEAGLSLAVLAELLFGGRLIEWLGETAPELPAGTVLLFYLAGTQLTLVGLVALRGLRQNRFLSHRALSPGLVFMLSFALLIAAGTLLLKSPRATPHGISWVDALFTSTSAVCVTGLVTVDTASAFTPAGHWMLLGLIQVGGLGVMTLTYFFAHLLAGGVSIRNRIALQDLLSEENLGQIGGVLVTIVGFTLACEAVGAFAIHASLTDSAVPAGGLVFFSLFHSVSAFCNAGFSTLTLGLADPVLARETDLIIVIMVLIVVGGLGFPVLRNLWGVAVGWMRRRRGLMEAPPRLTTHSRLVLAMSAVLILGGAVLIFFTEYVGNPRPAPVSPVLAALFNSITARTAGFNIEPTGELMPATVTILVFLMFVGGSPASTAGGIKTTTLAVAVLALRRLLTGRRDLEVFGRRIPEDTADRALAIVMLSLAGATIAAALLMWMHPTLAPLDLAFETVSALSTVGLSRGITPELGAGGKLLLVVVMFVGRVGVLLCLTAILRRPAAANYRLPESSLVIT